MDNYQRDHTALLKKFGKKLIDKARPYYDTLTVARKCHLEVRKAALIFEKVSQDWTAAKDAVAQAEAGLKPGVMDVTTLDHLNHVVEVLSEVEERRRRVSVAHDTSTQAFLKSDAKLMALSKSLKQTLVRTRPYFESKVFYNRKLAGKSVPFYSVRSFPSFSLACRAQDKSGE